MPWGSKAPPEPTEPVPKDKDEEKEEKDDSEPIDEIEPSDSKIEEEEEEEEEQGEEKVGCCARCFKYFKTTFLTSSCLLLINLVYVILGGVVFNILQTEDTAETNSRIPKFEERIEEVKQEFLDNYADYTAENKSPNRSKLHLAAIVNKSCELFVSYGEEMSHAYNNKWRLNDQTNVTDSPDGELWSISSSIVYCITVITTIGYGNMVPSTQTTQALTIVYALIGIPLMLMFIHYLGDNLGRGFEYFFYYATCMGERRKRRSKQEKIEKKKRAERRKKDPVRAEAYRKRRLARKKERQSLQVVIPVHVSVSLIGLYLCLGGLLFSKYGIGTWPFTDSIYFSFITLSTIGFGDFVFNENNDTYSGVSRNLKAFVVSVYIIFGLGLMSMCFDHMTAQFKDKIRTLGNYILRVKHKITDEE